MSNSEYTYSGDELIKSIRQLIRGTTIKYSNQAAIYETKDTKMDGDTYVAALQGTTNIYSYEQLSEEALKLAGCTGNQLSYYPANPLGIPKQFQENILKWQNYVYCRDYNEANDYYRKLNGLPPYEETTFLYAPMDFYAEYSIPITPVHKLDVVYIDILENRGEISKLKAANPKAGYLDYLGTKKIKIEIARKALNYEILDVNADVNENIIEIFTTTYELEREYFMHVIYNKSIYKNYTNYDSLVGLSIMIATINKMINDNIVNVVSRNIYDISMIRLLYDAYSIPFVDNLDLSYHQNLVANLNHLMQIKSTNKCLLMILDLFGKSTMDIIKYNLVKNHKLDDQGNPIFVYKEVEIDGQTVKVLDKEQMYDLAFELVSIRDEYSSDASSSVQIKNIESYSEVIEKDPYWIEDENLKTEIINREFNQIETKYLGLNVMYSTSNKLFDIQYAIRLLLDTKKDTLNYKFTLYKLFEDDEFTIFDITVFLLALLSKDMGFEGNILYKPESISSVLGYPFKADINKIIIDIQNDPNIDDEILKYIATNTIQDISDMDRIYVNIKSLYHYIATKIHSAQTLAEYDSYKHLYDVLLITMESQEEFTKHDGTIALTYKDMLSDISQKMYAYVDNIEVANIKTAMSLTVDVVEKVLPTFKGQLDKYLSNDDVVFTAITKLLGYFKSYTTDLINFYSAIVFNDSFDNIMKIIDQIHDIEFDPMEYREQLRLSYDSIDSIEKTMQFDDFFEMHDNVLLLGDSINGEVILKNVDEIGLEEKLRMSKDLIQKEGISITNEIKNIDKETEISDSITMKDEVKIVWDTDN